MDSQVLEAVVAAADMEIEAAAADLVVDLAADVENAGSKDQKETGVDYSRFFVKLMKVYITRL